jgi:hypothetical protein
MRTVFIYVNTSKQVGDADHLKVFSNVDAAEKWFEENDPEGVAFECDVGDFVQHVAAPPISLISGSASAVSGI